MHLLILTGAQLHAQPTLSHAIFSLRHKVFVDKLGWEAIRSPSGLETDAFDTDAAIHFVVLTSNGEIAAYSRLLPTTQPHLLSDVYPELLRGQTEQVGEDVWEWTRTTAIPLPVTHKTQHHAVSDLPFAINPAGRMLYLGIVEWAVKKDIKVLSLQCDPSFAGVIKGLGAGAEVVCKESVTKEGKRVVPMLMKIREGTVERMRACFGLEGVVESGLGNGQP
ncbi:acyl-CoA N-acyltransferase [Paraphoma chrysanthemicola]|nr:acyl-CoA N-acyltransferase [Paraphoma chrysanthemicola]